MIAPVFLFPGQGSQDVGMAREFYKNHDEARTIFELASQQSGLDVAQLCFEGPMEALTETKNLQPCMTAAVLACFRVFEKSHPLPPSFYAGHSLGEYAALAAAAVISDADCLKLVTARGSLMQAEAEANPGAMAAVLKMDPDKLAEVVAQLAQEHTICLANQNSPDQIVISGSEAAIEALKAPVAEGGGRYRKLVVSGAWHSPLMKGAEGAYNAIIDTVQFSDAKAPVLLNVTGAPETSGQVIKEQMKKQMCSGVRWYQGILHAWDQDARTFVEFGPKPTLTKMLRTIVPTPEQVIYLVDGEEKLAKWVNRHT